MKMTDFDLAKYDWRRLLGGGGAGLYIGLMQMEQVKQYRLHMLRRQQNENQYDSLLQH